MFMNYGFMLLFDYFRWKLKLKTFTHTSTLLLSYSSFIVKKNSFFVWSPSVNYFLGMEFDFRSKIELRLSSSTLVIIFFFSFLTGNMQVFTEYNLDFHWLQNDILKKARNNNSYSRANSVYFTSSNTFIFAKSSIWNGKEFKLIHSKRWINEAFSNRYY